MADLGNLLAVVKVCAIVALSVPFVVGAIKLVVIR